MSQEKNKWEMNYSHNPHFYNQRLVMCISGHSIDEVLEIVPKAQRFFTHMFRDSFRALGLNCDQRFKRFDPATPHPCILRSLSNRPDEQRGWYSSVYYDSKVYTPGHGIHTLAEHDELYPHLRHTSMLQVWV